MNKNRFYSRLLLSTCLIIGALAASGCPFPMDHAAHYTTEEVIERLAKQFKDNKFTLQEVKGENHVWQITLHACPDLPFEIERRNRPHIDFPFPLPERRLRDNRLEKIFHKVYPKYFKPDEYKDVEHFPSNILLSAPISSKNDLTERLAKIDLFYNDLKTNYPLLFTGKNIYFTLSDTPVAMESDSPKI